MVSLQPPGDEHQLPTCKHAERPLDCLESLNIRYSKAEETVKYISYELKYRFLTKSLQITNAATTATLKKVSSSGKNVHLNLIHILVERLCFLSP